MNPSAEIDDRLQNLIAVLILIASIVGTLLAWRASVAGNQARGADAVGLRASLNAADGRIVNAVYVYDHYRAYTTYRRNYEEALLLDEHLNSANPADDPVVSDQLEHLREQRALTAESMRWYFPGQYLNGDGSYDMQREWGELFATTSRNRDTNAAGYFERSDRFWTKSYLMIAIFILQVVVLAFLTLAKLVHISRFTLRKALLGVGMLCLVLSIAAGIYVEFGIG